MKYLFGVLTMILTSLTGWRKGEKLSEQVKEITYIILFLNNMKNRISFLHEPLPKIIFDYSENEAFPFIKNCSSYLKTLDFPLAWKKAVFEDGLLTEKDKNLLSEFGTGIGKADIETEISLIDYILAELKLSLSEKKEKEKNDKKLFRFFGIFIGLICFLIIV